MRRRNHFYGTGGFGYCAAKDKKYFGFKGHAVVNTQGLILNFTFAPANIDERDVLPELVTKYKGMLIADKGLIRPELTELLASQDLNLQTPLRKNMKDLRPKSVVYQMMNVRRLIEMVFGQLTDRFNIQSIRAKDLWHLTAKIVAPLNSRKKCNNLTFEKKEKDCCNGKVSTLEPKGKA
jgi:hypothetical protein